MLDFQEIRNEYGVNDFYGIWLFEDGMFLNGPGGEDHRLIGDPFEAVTKGAISCRKCTDGVLYLRVLYEHFYPAETRYQLEKLANGASFICVDFLNQDGSRARHLTSSDDDLLALMLSDPIAYDCAMASREV